MTQRQGHSDAHDDGCSLPLSQPHQAAGLQQIDSSDANVLQPNVVETDGAQSSGLNETVDTEVENMLQSVSDLIKTSEGIKYIRSAAFKFGRLDGITMNKT